MDRLDFDLVRRTRAQHPERILEAIRDRRRALFLRESPLLIIAADHTARGVMAAGSASMRDRYDLLERLATALRRPGVPASMVCSRPPTSPPTSRCSGCSTIGCS